MPAAEQKVGNSVAAEIDRLSDPSAVDTAITGRFANRRFSDRAVSRELIESILNVARFAPSGANIQPWHVYVAAGKSKQRLSALLVQAHGEAADRHRAEYQYYASELPEPYLSRREQFGKAYYGSLGIDRADQAARARQTARNYEFFGAPVGFVVTIDRRLEIGSWLDLGMFIQNIMIAARARGLATCPQETFAKYHALLRECLPIPAEEMVVCGLAIGFAEDSDAASRGIMEEDPRRRICEIFRV